MDTSTPSGPEPAPGPAAADPAAAHPTNSFFAGVRRLGITRSDDRWIGGVSGGIGDRFGIDPLLVRGIFFATLLLGGLGLVAYGVAWALLPERRDGRIHLEEMILGRFDIALLGALAFVVVGFGRGDSWFFFWGPPEWVQGLLWLTLVGGIVMVIAIVSNQQSPRPRPSSTDARFAPPVSGTGYAAGPAASYPAPGPAATYPAPPAGSPTYGAPPAAAPAPAWTVPTVQPRPPRPATPPKPRTPGAGPGTVGVVVALSLLSLALLLVAQRQGDFTGPVALTALSIFIVLAGLGMIVSGLRGRSSGSLAGLAITAVLVAVPVGVAQTTDWTWSSSTDRTFSADGVVLVSDRDVAADGFSMGFGDVTIDLTDVPMTSETLEVLVELAAGDLTVLVPGGDTTVTADIEAGAGTVSWDIDGQLSSVAGVGLSPRTITAGDVGADGPQLALQVRLGAGDVSILEEN
ncbi:PspC domain-containing protein [Cellulomonas fengjieae]|uniref:PspC domain-containing protein n=1 Tax=Cellulomonas fengjieae TaxID=2819978 RepID=UPI001AAF1A98|nr:PspC domain-containing protein [Cellulomonas fengjieae]MBO3101615.1 PspC domain-containing protein [Cellulomonas fengjieae]